MKFQQAYQVYLDGIEQALPEFLPKVACKEGGLVVEAARYSLLSGGKRIRPVLLLSVCDLLHGRADEAMPFACALEMIHTYSLIHDDLPCMDNDDFRRGRSTCHKQYGEAMAVLAGDTLLNRAYELLFEALQPDRPDMIAAGRLIAAAAGYLGMIGGQTLDLAAEGRKIEFDALRKLHRMKTGALIQAPIMAAAALARADSKTAGLLQEYAGLIGLAFQIQDDILDVTADDRTLGKSTGKDARDEKSTYVTLLGLEQAGHSLKETIGQAFDKLGLLLAAGYQTSFLEGLTSFLLNRSH